MACSTCHVSVAPEWFDRLPAASEEEEDMLDFAAGACRTSRLSCQILLDETLDGLSVTVPSQAQDRKSVVKGKSVAVRVDLGGRRIIRKKNNSRKTDNEG